MAALWGVLMLFAGAGAAQAQAGDSALGVAVSYSARSNSPFPQPIELTTLEIEWVLPVTDAGRWGLEYAAAGTFAAVRHNPTGKLDASGRAWVVWHPSPPTTTFGFGLRALGTRVWVGGERLRLQGDLGGGFLYFGTPLLAANATRFNFAGTASLGVRVATGERGYVVLGYRIHHASNGGLGEVNPGMDSHQVYVGAWLR